MKKFVTLVFGLLLFFSAGCPDAFGQKISGTDELTLPEDISYRTGNLWSGDLKLAKSDLKTILPESLYADFRRSKRLYNSGLGLVISGGVLGVAGGTALLIGPLDPMVGKYVYSYMYLVHCGNLILGSALLISGVPCLCVGVHGMKHVASNYNEYTPLLTFGPTLSGFGLAYNF